MKTDNVTVLQLEKQPQNLSTVSLLYIFYASLILESLTCQVQNTLIFQTSLFLTTARHVILGITKRLIKLSPSIGRVDQVIYHKGLFQEKYPDTVAICGVGIICSYRFSMDIIIKKKQAGGIKKVCRQPTFVCFLHFQFRYFSPLVTRLMCLYNQQKSKQAFSFWQYDV